VSAGATIQQANKKLTATPNSREYRLSQFRPLQEWNTAGYECMYTHLQRVNCASQRCNLSKG